MGNHSAIVRVESFKLLSKIRSLSVYQCPQCYNEFATSSRTLKCPKCFYPEKGSEFKFAIKRAKSEIHSLIKTQGFIRRKTELQPIIDTLTNEFPNAQRVDILGSLELDNDKIRDERYNLDLHEYKERRKREDLETGRHRRTLRKALEEEEMTEDSLILLLQSMERKRRR